MREIRGVALGTYYAKGSSEAKASPKASDMRGLVFAVKNNREPPNALQVIGHARHPATPPGLKVDRSNAIEYVAAIVNRHLPLIRSRLGIQAGGAVLVPVPSSTVTKATLGSDRFPALKLALALEAIGLGECCPLAANVVPGGGKTAGTTKTIDSILENLLALRAPPPKKAIVLIDDVVTTGADLAAMDVFLGCRPDTFALVVGLSDGAATRDATIPRSFVVTYDEEADPHQPTLKLRRPHRPI